MTISALFSTLVIVGVIVWLFAAVERGARAQMSEEVRKPQIQATPGEPPVSARRPRLNIEGGQRVTGPVGFVKGFALPPAHIGDLVKVVGPATLATLPQSVQRALHSLYQDGGLHGLEIVDLLFRNGSIAPGQALYFAMVAPPNQPIHVVGFIDRDRP